MAGRFDDAVYAAANAGDINVSTGRGYRKKILEVSSERRVTTARETILRFLQAIEDESITVLELREELE